LSGLLTTGGWLLSSFEVEGLIAGNGFLKKKKTKQSFQL
jgi:hypothetical protein